MIEAVDDWLVGSATCDCRNGFYRRHLLTELGDIKLSVPRNRLFCQTGVLKSYARRAPGIDRVILAGFVLGLSTRKAVKSQFYWINWRGVFPLPSSGRAHFPARIPDPAPT